MAQQDPDRREARPIIGLTLEVASTIGPSRDFHVGPGPHLDPIEQAGDTTAVLIPCAELRLSDLEVTGQLTVESRYVR